MDGTSQVKGVNLSELQADQQTTEPVNTNRVKIQVHIDDKCPICDENFIDKEKKTLFHSVLSSKDMGTVHDKCFLPYHSEENIKVLFKVRCWSIGDAISVTPVIRELKRLYPKIQITVLTFFPDLFKHNPNVSAILDMNHPVLQAVLDQHPFHVDGFKTETKMHFAMHSVEFAAQSAFSRSLLPDAWQYEINYADEDRATAKKVIRDHGLDPHKDKIIVLHPHDTEWATRNWGSYGMNDLAAKLKADLPGFKFVSVGGKREQVKAHVMKNYVPFRDELGVVDLYGKLSLLETAAMLDLRAIKLMVTPDTGALHLAASRPHLPIVGVFTLIKAFFRTPVRNGKFSDNFIGVNADDPCNCTFDNRFLTNEAFFGTCPKLAFLEQTDKMTAPEIVRLDGLRNYITGRTWTKDNLNEQIAEELVRYNPRSLPCFPTVEKVYQACMKLLHKTGSI